MKAPPTTITSYTTQKVQIRLGILEKRSDHLNLAKWYEGWDPAYLYGKSVKKLSNFLYLLPVPVLELLRNVPVLYIQRLYCSFIDVKLKYILRKTKYLNSNNLKQNFKRKNRARAGAKIRQTLDVEPKYNNFNPRNSVV